MYDIANVSSHFAVLSHGVNIIYSFNDTLLCNGDDINSPFNDDRFNVSLPSSDLKMHSSSGSDVVVLVDVVVVV